MAATVALLALVCVIISIITALALRHFLIGQLDNQLAAASARSKLIWDTGAKDTGSNNGGTNKVPGEGPPRIRFPAGQAAGTISVRIIDGVVQEAGALDPNGEVQPLSPAQRAAIVAIPRDKAPHTRNLPDLGNYRLIAIKAPRGEVITGLSLSTVDDTVWRLVAVEAGVSTAALILAAGAGILIVRLALRPLRRVTATAVQVTALPLDRGEVMLPMRIPESDPRTEVGQVSAAVNRMIDHVGAALTTRQASETRVRQFVADASHELRTPLAAIRGYAELANRGKDDVPPTVAYAIERVESASERMTTLVDDLLLLARLDDGRPLVEEPVDLSRLIVDAVSDARVAGHDHVWRLDLPDTPVTVTGDDQRLHQVVANLLANARTHTPAGTTVTVRLAAQPHGSDPPTPAAATISVHDTGPGIPPELLPEIFMRFTRGDSSRSRAEGSSGLGLAIVAAVVTAHLGRVTVTSAPGDTTFTVHLPITEPEG